MSYYQVSTKIHLSKIINNSTKRAIRDRLVIILNELEKMHDHWHSQVKHRLNPTRQKQVQRKFDKRIQAIKIVIHYLTPFDEQVDDEPTILRKKVQAVSQSVIFNQPKTLK